MAFKMNKNNVNFGEGTGSSPKKFGAGFFRNVVDATGVAQNQERNQGQRIDIPVNGDLYVAAIAKGALDFRTTVQVNESNFAAGTQTVITLDTKDATLCFAPGDVIHAVDDAVLGTIKTVDSATQITLTKANEDAIEDDDVLYNVSPIQLILSCECFN